ncbi:nitrate reductase molybdenum cofactor assembly chaperone [Oceanithermus desulfurans]|uniref:Nitrate reductase molybdenum cofactor assembly chaperone n=2 Tax=Oceanithermus desulfurans TaxID=227924 RepID=A0A511RGZ8_9DEIN|nr:nitrate reductase [Oceanithermus desulfurans]MBB6028856.1 nitrate reductase delta subunit [Oceanithermus desulfurans]GEM88915.1 hypothetical protein ODE01S_03490 [Oceanithermus desulfurans NBRC 100063]
MFEALALAFTYPREGLLEALEAELERAPAGPARKAFARFVAEVKRLELARWEEVYTATLDMNPRLVPYIGYVVWGESYRRGEFLARLKQAMDRLDLDTAGELPDHLVPVLRYLARTDEPLPELLEVLEPALARIRKDLHALEATNPYLHLLDALLQQVPAPERRKT